MANSRPSNEAMEARIREVIGLLPPDDFEDFVFELEDRVDRLYEERP